MPFTLTIRERGHSWAGRGPVTSTHASPEDARDALVEYVLRNWESELDEEMPANSDELVSRYFEGVLETYEITEATA